MDASVYVHPVLQPHNGELLADQGGAQEAFRAETDAATVRWIVGSTAADDGARASNVLMAEQISLHRPTLPDRQMVIHTICTVHPWHVNCIWHQRGRDR